MWDFIFAIDYSFLERLHQMAIRHGEWLTSIMRLISLLGEKGIVMFLLSFLLMLRPKTRRTGFCMFLAVSIGTIIGNGFLKHFLNRPRPFHTSIAEFRDWWQYVGAMPKQSSSFPSGHVMAIVAGFQAMFLMDRKKYSILLMVLGATLMGASRCYFMVHYLTDVLGGIAVGMLSTMIAYSVMPFFWRVIRVDDIFRRFGL